MFNKTIINRSNTEYIPYEKSVNVTEVKAPTDKSVELLNDMQEEARKNIIKSVTIENNIFNVTFDMYASYLDHSKIVVYKYILNGKEYTGEIKVNVMHNENKMYNMLCKQIQDNLFREITEPLSKIIGGRL